ncbi:MAG: S8 family serine peptidase [Proteobacteria bacterium]|nr:S8 family serine peptidase [Pseudomonadota bacterium]
MANKHPLISDVATTVLLAVLTISVTIGLLGCGLDEQEDITGDQTVPITLNTDQGSASSEQVYLVAFKGKQPHILQAFSQSWQSLRQQFMKDILSYLSPIAALEATDVGYLSSFPLYSQPLSAKRASRMGIGSELAGVNQPQGRSWHSSNQVILSRVKFHSLATAKRVLNQLYQQGKIWYAEPDYKRSLSSITDIARQYKAASTAIYHINMINLASALDDIAQLGAGEHQRIKRKRPIIAVLDSGVDVYHPALKNQIIDLTKDSWVDARACPGDRFGCDTSQGLSKELIGTGRVYPIGTSKHGESCSGSRRLVQPVRQIKLHKYCRHGTLVAGLAAGNSRLVYGACPFCQILPVKIVDANLDIFDSSIIRGLEYLSLVKLKDNRTVRVVNVSLGKSSKSISVSHLMRRLSIQHNILFVAAAGNDNTMIREFPGSLQEVLGVTAIDGSGKKFFYGNYGHWISISAPGSHMLSSAPGGEVEIDHGTSLATPLVAGVAGLVLATSPKDLSSFELKTILEKTANSSKLYALNEEYTQKQVVMGGKKGSLGWGVIDAQSAIKYVQKESLGEVTDHKRKVRFPGCASLGFGPSSGNPWDGWPWFLVCCLAMVIGLVCLSMKGHDGFRRYHL